MSQHLANFMRLMEASVPKIPNRAEMLSERLSTLKIQDTIARRKALLRPGETLSDAFRRQAKEKKDSDDAKYVFDRFLPILLKSGTSNQTKNLIIKLFSNSKIPAVKGFFPPNLVLEKETDIEFKGSFTVTADQVGTKMTLHDGDFKFTPTQAGKYSYKVSKKSGKLEVEHLVKTDKIKLQERKLRMQLEKLEKDAKKGKLTPEQEKAIEKVKTDYNDGNGSINIEEALKRIKLIKEFDIGKTTPDEPTQKPDLSQFFTK